MKELTIWQKAQRYDEAINAIKELKAKHPTALVIKDWIKENFPELAESEDERIRKWLIALIKSNEYGPISNVGEMPCSKLNVIAWLEKQAQKAWTEEDKKMLKWVTGYLENKMLNAPMGEERTACKNAIAWFKKLEGEQKPIDKVEPKFKVGDWVIFNEHHNSVYQVEKIQGLRYYLRHYNGGSLSVHIDNELIRLWTIQDAKDGDVLACESGWTCIFKALVNDETFSSYCFMDNTKWLCETGSECHTLKEEFVKSYNGKIYPATKEQRNLLFEKMREAGYVWDAEKKELKKIKQKPDSGGFWEGYDTAKEKFEQKPAEWSEEDERHINTITSLLEDRKKEQTDWGVEVLNEEIAWLKSIKDRLQPQSQWKPSDGQMKALKEVCDEHWEQDGLDPLYKLYQDLKKLMEK